MLLSVALMPPDHVLDDVEAMLARTPAPPGEFSWVGRSALMIPVFGLGNITRVEVSAIATYLSDELVDPEPAPRVRFSGAWALEEEGDPTVALPLVGEVDRVRALARNLQVLVADHGFFVDRRKFVPRLTLGAVTPTTTLPFLERLVGALAEHATPIWSVDSVALVRRRFDDDAETEIWEVVETVSTTRHQG
jgi:2'-5' RNA ligase